MPTTLVRSVRRPAANRVGFRFLPMSVAILRDGALDLATGLACADGARDRMRHRIWIEAYAGNCGIVAVSAAAGGRWKLRRGRNPRRPLEDVLERAPLLNMNVKVCPRHLKREAGRRPSQPLANALEGVVVSRLLGTRCGPEDSHAHQRQGHDTHAISTIPPSVWPVEDG